MEEMLQLVAEQAREIVGAVCCVATVALPGQPRAAEGARIPRRSGAGRRSCGGSTCPAVYRLIRASGGSARLGGDELARAPLFRVADGAHPLRGWLAASLTALDGSELGAIQLFDKRAAAFTETTSPRSCISPRWRRRRSSGRSSTTSEERKAIDRGPGRACCARIDRGPRNDSSRGFAARRDCRRARRTGGGLRRLELRHNCLIRGHLCPGGQAQRSSKLVRRSGRPPRERPDDPPVHVSEGHPVRDTAPRTDSGGPAHAVDTAQRHRRRPVIPSREGAQERPARGTGRAAPLRCEQRSRRRVAGRRPIPSLTEEAPMRATERLAAEHRERLERFRRHADRVREIEVSRIASTSSESSPTTSPAPSAAISPATTKSDGGDQRPAPATRRPQT